MMSISRWTQRARLTRTSARIAALAGLGLVLGVAAPAQAGEVYLCKMISDCAGEEGCDPNPRVYVLDPTLRTIETGGYGYRLDDLEEEDGEIFATASPDRGDIEITIDSDGDAIIVDDETYLGTCQKARR